MSDLIPSMHLF